MKNLNFLFAAYTTVWVMLFFYILTMAKRNRALGEEIEELRDLLRSRQPPARAFDRADDDTGAEDPS